MRSTILPLVFVALAALSLLAHPQARSAAAATAPETTVVNYLPDSAVLIRVNDRVVRVRDFVEDYFAGWAEYRPAPDSAGRVQLMNQILNKEILASVALKTKAEFGFEERLVMRGHAQRVLSNVLYERLVLDSVNVTDAEVEQLKAEYSCEKNLHQIVVPDMPTAQRLRQELLDKKIDWKAATRRYPQTGKLHQPEDLGWIRRSAYPPEVARLIFDFAPGQIALPYRDTIGVHLIRVAARRAAEPSIVGRYEHLLRREVRGAQQARLMEQIMARLRAQAGLVPDEQNLTWAARFFEAPPPLTDKTGALVPRRLVKLPLFAPEDTGRVMARWTDGQMSLNRFMSEYRQTSPYLRTALNTPELLRKAVEALALEPRRAQLAVDLGLDKHPRTIQLIERKREQMLVEHLYQDSVMSRVYIGPQERRKYYDQHIAQYITFPKVRFAGIAAATKAGADSIAARLRGGEPAEKVMAAEKERRGRVTGRIDSLTANDEGLPFYKLLFEDLRPGQVSIEFADQGGFWVIQSLAYDSGKQLSYGESERMVQETLENVASEKLLTDLLARHRRKLSIETHPELVMRVKLEDPIAPE